MIKIGDEVTITHDHDLHGGKTGIVCEVMQKLIKVNLHPDKEKLQEDITVNDLSFLFAKINVKKKKRK